MLPFNELFDPALAQPLVRRFAFLICHGPISLWAQLLDSFPCFKSRYLPSEKAALMQLLELRQINPANPPRTRSCRLGDAAGDPPTMHSTLLLSGENAPVGFPEALYDPGAVLPIRGM